MKKIVSILVLFLLVIAMLSTVVNAATSADELTNKLYEMGKPYGLTEAEKNKIRTYLKSADITDAKAEEVVAKAQKAINVMKSAGVTDYTKLTTAQKTEVKNNLIEAAAILDFTVVVKNNAGRNPSIVISYNGKTIDELPFNPKTDEILLADTGSNTNIILVVSSIAVIALVAGIAVKKFANA